MARMLRLGIYRMPALVLIDRNWRGRSGEVDLVALDGAILVICEVKTRTSDQFGGPLAAVTPPKSVGCGGSRPSGWQTIRFKLMDCASTLSRCGVHRAVQPRSNTSSESSDGARENVLCRGDGCAGTHR